MVGSKLLCSMVVRKSLLCKLVFKVCIHIAKKGDMSGVTVCRNGILAKVSKRVNGSKLDSTYTN